MKVSNLLMPTLREVPAEAEVISHQLLLRAGFIRRVAAGVYTLLPLAWRVIRKIEQIIREEMDKQGGQELMLPIIQPAELWRQSGRWDVYGPELFRLQDRHGRNFCLGPTHEEIITALVRGEVNSYKQLPLLLYQIQNKYRDERRPRFGLLRGREFIMKDLYSFDRDEVALDISYEKMFTAYTNVFRRCGLKFRPVLADSGAIGGSDTHEFVVLAQSGEATILFCADEKCGYAANEEKAESKSSTVIKQETPLPLQKTATPNLRTIDEVAAYLNVLPEQMIKTMVYTTEKDTVVALVRGDREVNEVKLYNVLNCVRLEKATDEIINTATGASAGFVGPVGLPNLRIVADLEVMSLVNAVGGANEQDYHLLHINPGRDFTPEIVVDIRLAKAGEGCPLCGAILSEAKGIEVGQIFKLGVKYSQAMGASFLDEKGKSSPFVMGCYGIGVTRTMAAAVEQNYDQQGIIWPLQIAPYEVLVLPVSTKDQQQMQVAFDLYQKLLDAGIEVIIDDRSERAGVKFKDADLVGYPLRITVGKSLANGEVELYRRKEQQTVAVAVDDVVHTVQQMLKQMAYVD